MQHEDIIAQAKWEIQFEKDIEAVERAKERIRAGRWWHKLLPFTIEIKRRNS